MGEWIRNRLLDEDTPLYEAFVRAGVPDKKKMSEHIITLFYFHLRTREPRT